MGTDLGTPYEPSFYVYALRDPVTRMVGYVGVTSNPRSRTAMHWRDRLRGTDRKANWLRKLAAKGKRPEFLILEATTAGARLITEEKWIVRLAAEGHPLTNFVHVPRPDKPPQRVEPAGFSDYVTVTEAAAAKGVLEGTVRRRIERGRLPARKVGRQWFIRRRDLDDWKVRKGANDGPSSSME